MKKTIDGEMLEVGGGRMTILLDRAGRLSLVSTEAEERYWARLLYTRARVTTDVEPEVACDGSVTSSDLVKP